MDNRPASKGRHGPSWPILAHKRPISGGIRNQTGEVVIAETEFIVELVLQHSPRTAITHFQFEQELGNGYSLTDDFFWMEEADKPWYNSGT